jgi:hypothetical protein
MECTFHPFYRLRFRSQMEKQNATETEHQTTRIFTRSSDADGWLISSSLRANR